MRNYIFHVGSVIWNYLPLASSILSSGLGMFMTACPKRIFDWEEKYTWKVRFMGFIFLIVGASGAISGYQQQNQLATKADLTLLATKTDIEHLKAHQRNDSKFNPKDIDIFTNGIKTQHYSVNKPVACVNFSQKDLEQFRINVHNNSPISLSNLEVIVEILGCELSSSDSNWRHIPTTPAERGSLEFTPYYTDTLVNPGLPIDLPEINVKCSDVLNHPGVIALSIKNTKPMQFNFCINKGP